MSPITTRTTESPGRTNHSTNEDRGTVDRTAHESNLAETSNHDKVYITSDITSAHSGSNLELSQEVCTALFGQEDVKVMSPDDKYTFQKSRMKEIKGLESRQTFEVVDEDCVPQGVRTYGTRWVHCLKTFNGTQVEKYQLVSQNYRDHEATKISTRPPTVSRMGQRFAISTASLAPTHRSYVRDISQAYVQSERYLERRVYLRPPKEMGLELGKILLALKPLFGIPESGLHWFITYQGYHIQRLQIDPCHSDPCVLFTRDPDGQQGNTAVTVLQVDDTYGHGDKSFIKQEEKQSHHFVCKPRTMLDPGDSAHFNRSRISVHDQGIHKIDQSAKLKAVKVPSNKEELVSTRAQIQYITSCTRPELCAAVQLMAKDVTDPQPQTFKKMEKIVKWCHDTQEVGLTFVPLRKESLKISLFTGASFANDSKHKSQIGFVLVLTEEKGTANVVHYGISACNRVTRSVMAAELLASVYGFDQSYVLQHMIQQVLGKRISVVPSLATARVHTGCSKPSFQAAQ